MMLWKPGLTGVLYAKRLRLPDQERFTERALLQQEGRTNLGHRYITLTPQAPKSMPALRQ